MIGLSRVNPILQLFLFILVFLFPICNNPQDSTKIDTISITSIKSSQIIFDLNFDEKENEMLISGLKSNKKRFELLHNYHLNNLLLIADQ